VPVTRAVDERALELFEQHLTRFLATHARREPVAAQIAYHFGIDDANGARQGKRLRPRLVMAAAAAYGARAERTLAACTAVELLHNYSLMHDDIEDGDELRHGRRALWAQYGLEHGINGGDAVGALAQLALEPVIDSHGAEIAFVMSMDLARANLRLCEGQALDLALAQDDGARATLDTYLEMIDGKTAALFGCSAAIGAACASAAAEEVERSRDVGRLFGLGFQIADDLAGIWGTTQATGKTPGGDLARHKKTYPVLWAIDRDPEGTGSAIASAYETSIDLDPWPAQRVREVLDACGAYAATRAAADTYFEEALERALGTQPLSDFVMQNRT
jgi:geranylgeranyl diphosphate synthase, type I